MTKIVNLFGGPCLGKSTLAAELFAYFKKHTDGEYELINETAKDYSWEERWIALGCQPYIFGQQLFKQQKLLGKVDYIFTDSPIILSNVYESRFLDTNFPKAVIDIFNTFENINFVLKRTGDFNEHGRHHNLEEAIAADNKVLDILNTNKIPYKLVDRDDAASIIQNTIFYQMMERNANAEYTGDRPINFI